jgi:hypothetical protein
MASSSTFQNSYPFISCIKINDAEYIGIIINFDDYVTSLYDVSMLRSDSERLKLLELGEVWWWESNRKLPINIFLKKEMISFRYCIKTFNSKDVELLFGPIVNLSEIAEKRIKRKSIQLVRTAKSTRN